MEYTDVYNAIKVPNGYPEWGTGAPTVADQAIPTLICPSCQVALGAPAVKIQADQVWGTIRSSKTNYLGNGGPKRTYNGTVADRRSASLGTIRKDAGVSFKDVTDGLSKTVMICEQLGYNPVSRTPGTADFRQCKTNAVATTSSWYWNFHGVNTGCLTSMQNGPNTVQNDDTWSATSPYSFHPGGLTLAFGDGSTQFISETIAITIWNAIANKADGSSLSP
jgi:hypothetical protein